MCDNSFSHGGSFIAIRSGKFLFHTWYASLVQRRLGPGTCGPGVSGIAVSTRFRRSPRTFRVLNAWIFSFTFYLAMLVDDTWDCIEVGPANHPGVVALSACVCVDSRAWPVGGEMDPSFFVLKTQCVGQAC
jgi:hypothetical protein